MNCHICSSVLPSAGEAASGGSAKGAEATRSVLEGHDTQHGCRENSPRTRGSDTDAYCVISFDRISSLPYLSLSSAAAYSSLFRLSNGFHRPLFLSSKSLSFKRCNGVWGEEALENYASCGFYVREGGIDHPQGSHSLFFFFWLVVKFITFLVLQKHNTRIYFPRKKLKFADKAKVLFDPLHPTLPLEVIKDISLKSLLFLIFSIHCVSK